MNKLRSVLIILIISACSLAPKFKAPETKLPETFKEQSEIEIDGVLWKQVGKLEKNEAGQWWKVFGDQELNALIDQATAANPSLKSAAARVEQSRSAAGIAKGGLFPNIDIGANAVRSKPSNASMAAFGGSGSANLKPYTIYGTDGVIAYEADLFGRVRDGVKAAELEADAQNSLYNSAILALQADVATNYFLLRSLDLERTLLQKNVEIRAKANRIMQKRFKEGDTGEQDLSRTKSELASVQAELIALDRQRAKIEHALAILLGKLPSEFSFAASPIGEDSPPLIPAGVPSTLLQRRHDIISAVSLMQAANARIGVARSAFFPSLSLTASAGYSSTAMGSLFDVASQSWALGQLAGNALKLPIFSGGAGTAALKGAKAAYEESVANYRQQVLVAFRDVEDNLVDQKMLAEQAKEQDAAAKAATRTATLSRKRYNEGESSYFEVVDSERGALAAERAAAQVRGQRFITTIATIRALGGGWE